MNKGKKSILNAIVGLVQMLVTCLIGLVFNRIILGNFGSSANGINATVSQIVNAIMIVEGGFTLASNVALFEPWGKGDVDRINGILSATKKRFDVIGWIALSIGLLIALLYPFTVNSEMSYFEIVALMLTALLPMCYNLGVTTKYRVVLLTEQKEYIISLISLITYVIGMIVAMVAVQYFDVSLVVARAIIMLSLFASYIAIAIFCKKNFPFISFRELPQYGEIKGTKSVIVMKLTSVLYTSAPIIIISMLPEGGFALASVYAVYNSIMSVVNSGLSAVVNAPRLGLGALFAENDKKSLTRVYTQYEIISFMGLSVILGTAAFLILPFVRMYTKGIEDVNYIDALLAILLIAKNFFEILHIPSGQMIQMSGSFQAAKKIQIIACVALAILLMVGFVLADLYVVICAVLFAAIVLAVLEIIYAEKNILNRGWLALIRSTIPALVLCVICTGLGMSRLVVCNNFYEFVIIGGVFFVAISLTTLLVYYIIDKDTVRIIIALLLRNIVRKREAS